MAAGEQSSVPCLVMLETWSRERGVPIAGPSQGCDNLAGLPLVVQKRSVRRTLFDKLICFFVSNYHASFVHTDNSLIEFRISTLTCHA